MRTIPVTDELSRIPEGFPYSNAYLLKTTDGITLFDPAVPFRLVDDGYAVDRLIATHGHYDHVASLQEWKEKTGAPFWAAEAEVPLLIDSRANASLMFGRPTVFDVPDRLLRDGQVIALDEELGIHVIHTPGHTAGSLAFLLWRVQNGEHVPLALLTGDTVFAQGYGRTDLATGDEEAMMRSLSFLLRYTADLPPELPVCPGHGAVTTAANVRRMLPYFIR